MKLTDALTPALLKTTQAFIDGLHSMNIVTALDLLQYLPRTYEDLSEVSTLADAPLNEKVTLRGTLHRLKLVRTRSRKVLVQAQFMDESGSSAEVVWFNQPHIMRMLKEGQMLTITGKVNEDGYKLKISSPQFEDASKLTVLHAGRIVAVYSQTEQISSRWLREKMALIKPAISLLPETLPDPVIKEEKIMKRSEAFLELHFPSTPEKLEQARARMGFEEMYHIQIDALERKKMWQGERQDRLKVPMDVELIKAFFACQSFTPTGGQKVAIYEILKDMEQSRPMSRLLEGDVGSGKTLVAVAVMANVLAWKGQCALMVPTEVLARQHLTTVSRLLFTFHSFIQAPSPSFAKATAGKPNPSPRLLAEQRGEGGKDIVKIDVEHLKSMPSPRVALLTGSMTQSEANAVRRDLASGLIDIVIGTHSLIEDSVQFKDLKLAIIDEQHRFGVEQRRKLADKGSPHVLAMTATPIPRTLALTAYGDHDLSVLMEKPGQRKKIKTTVVPPSERRTVELFIDAEIEKGRQVYVICPLISESKVDEMAEVRSVEQEKKRLSEEFPRRRIALLHGKLVPDEKSSVMNDFKNHEYDILVSTSVIEVGIDVPNTTIIVIEGSERFGLSQLHQFRGRVGRSDEQSYCFLFTSQPGQANSERLKAMEKHDSGFMLAEIDLKLRGPGEIFGLRQSGIPEVRFGGLLNVDLVLRARKSAEKFLLM